MSKEHTVKALPHIYNQAFKKLPVPLIILNNEMVIIDINEAATQSTGIDENFCDSSLLNVFVVDGVTTPTELSIVLNKPEPFEASLLKAQNTDSPYTNGTKVSGSVSITDQGSVQKVHYLFSTVS
ncbi:MAG TPA: PAS domain-containing protein, partial [Bacteroidales bacterium]|nr:PAS domain-containing protein [Bacteroidales bacterium]